MDESSFRIEEHAVSFWVKVKPRSSFDRLKLDSAGDLRLDLRAPAVEGRANEACREFFARALRLPSGAVEIARGARARRKLIRIECPNGEAVAQRLRRLAQGAEPA
jgi:uncharacterized protein